MAKVKEAPKVEESKESKQEIVEIKQGEVKVPIPAMQLKEMKVILKQEREKRAYLLRFIRDNLTPGIDYAMIHRKRRNEDGKWVSCKYKDETVLRDKKGALIYQCPDCGAKYSLWKPGAESICGYLRIRPHFEIDHNTIEILGLVGKGVAHKCTLIEEQSGEIVSEGGGARTLAQDDNDINKCIKMSMKSSHIDATCRLKGLSEMFTQDIEDMIGEIGDIFEITWKTKAGYDKVRELINDSHIKANLKAILIKGINDDSEEDKMIEWILGLQPELGEIEMSEENKKDIPQEEENPPMAEDTKEGKSYKRPVNRQELFDRLTKSHVFPNFEVKQLQEDFLIQPSHILSFMQQEIARRKMIEQMIDAGKLTGKILKTLSAMTQDQIEHIAMDLGVTETKKARKGKLEDILVEVSNEGRKSN